MLHMFSKVFKKEKMSKATIEKYVDQANSIS